MFPTVANNSAPEAADSAASAVVASGSPRPAVPSLSQPNLSKQPTMTLKQITLQLNAHAASVGVNPQNGSVGSISTGSASAVLQNHIGAQKSVKLSPNRVNHGQQPNV